MLVPSHRTAKVPNIYRLSQIVLEYQFWRVERHWCVYHVGGARNREC